MAAAECEVARGPMRRFQYMWADAGISGFSRLAALNPARWSSSMKLNRLLEELESLSSSRPLRLYMTSDEEQLNREFDSVSDALQWLRAQFPRDANEALEEAPAEGGWSLFGSCLQPSVAEPELEVVPPSNAEHDDGEHDTPDSPAPADEASPSSPSTAATPAGHGLEGEAKVQYMWADARVLPMKAIQELSRHNPARWSKAQRPLDLAEELEAMDTMRPVLLSLSTSRGQLQRRFHSAAAAAQWLRSSCGDMQRLDEERLCVICLTAPRTVMLMPCRHAVLCERCLEVLMERTPSSCPVCRQRIQNHARGHFVDDYVELVRALEMRMERSQMAAYEGMYNHIRPLMVTGALLATGAAAFFVVCPPAAPALLAGAGVVGYLPWFATTVANFEEEPVEQRTQQIFTAEDWASPLTLGVKGVVLLVAAPVALTVFFVPYGLYAGVLRPVGRLLGRLALRGAVALHVSVLRHVPALLRGMADGAVALGNLLGDVLGVTAQAIYDWILAPSWSGLRWLASKAAAGASWIYANALVPLGRALQGCGAAAWHGMESAGSAVYHQVLAPLGRLLARGAEAFYALALVPAASAIWTGLQGLWNQVLLPTAGATWEGLKILGRALSVAAEWTYGSVLRPLAGCAYGLVYYSTTGLWNYVLVPTAGATWQGLKMLGGALSLAAEQTYGYVLRPLAGGLYSYLFLPVVNGITLLAVGTAQAVGYVLSAAASGATLVAGASYQYVLQPLGSAAAAASQAVYSYVLRPLPGAVYNVLSACASAVAVAAGGCYQYLLLPVGSAVADLGRATYSYVLLPCGRAGMAAASFVVQVTTSAGQTIYVHVLCPAGQLSVAAVEAIGSSLQQGGQAVRVACQSLRRAF